MYTCTCIHVLTGSLWLNPYIHKDSPVHDIVNEYLF